MLWCARILARGGAVYPLLMEQIMIFKLLETNRQTDSTIILGSHTARPEALIAWRTVAWLHVDYAHLWHRLEEDENEEVLSLSA